MKGTAKSYPELREYMEGIPLVDCHDHSQGICRYADAMHVVANGYFTSDLQSASTEAELAIISDSGRSMEERWPVLEAVWKRTCHTGYAQVVRRVMREFYGEETLSLDALQRMNSNLPEWDEAQFDAVLAKAGIAARLLDIWPSVRQVLDGSLKMTPRGRLVIGLPAYHGVTNYNSVQQFGNLLDRRVTSLDEYLAVCRELFEGFKRYGAVAFKDQSAYSRTLAYDNPTRAEAEAVFNWFMEDPRRSASYPDGVKPLDDYLFHEFMRMARDMDLPVQIHTGHMAGIRNDVVKTNAIGLTRLLELHRDVRFDLFHANWPYDGELLYLAKNYPNVSIDFCWANIIDPVYCRRMFMQALSSVPHSKVHGYGSDFGGMPDRAWAHASIARDNMAIALSEMVEIEYLGLDDAKEVAHAWLFDNANRFFRLGL